MEETPRRRLRLGLVPVAFLVAGWLFYRSAWVVDHIVRGERDSSPIVYVIYGAWTWVPAVLVVVWGIRSLVQARR